MKKCVFAGTFDPFTVGHEDTVKKCVSLFDETVVAVCVNSRKRCVFSPIERKEMIERVFAGEKGVRVLCWEGTAVDLLRAENTPFYVRGVRNTVDFECETADFYASRDLSPEMITLYLPAEQKNLHISSTLVKNCIRFHKPYGDYVPAAVYCYLKENDNRVFEAD